MGRGGKKIVVEHFSQITQHRWTNVSNTSQLTQYCWASNVISAATKLRRLALCAFICCSSFSSIPQKVCWSFVEIKICDSCLSIYSICMCGDVFCVLVFCFLLHSPMYASVSPYLSCILTKDMEFP